jgi:hypothetical protein
MMSRSSRIIPIPKLADKDKNTKKIDDFFMFSRKCNLLLGEFTTIEHLEGLGKSYSDFLRRFAMNRGLVEMVKYNKKVRNYFTRYLSGQPEMQKSEGIPLTKDGLPLSLGGDLLRIARRGSHAEKRVVLSQLYGTRALSVGTSPNYGAITDPNRSEKLDYILSELAKLVPGFYRCLGYHQKARRSLKMPLFERFHFTTKSGPNGHAL